MFFVCSASTHWIELNPLQTTENIVQVSMIDGKLLIKNQAHGTVVGYESQNAGINQTGSNSHTQQKAALSTDCNTSYDTRIGLCFSTKLYYCNRKWAQKYSL